MKYNISMIMLLLMAMALSACSNKSTADSAAMQAVEETVDDAVTTAEEVSEEVLTDTVTEVSAADADNKNNGPSSESETVSESEPVLEADSEPYTYTDMTATMYASSNVNLRDIPDKSGNKIGGLSLGDEVSVTGKCNETGGYRIDKSGDIAYVSNDYLVEDKPVVEAVDNQVSSGTKQDAGSGNYDTTYLVNPVGTWYASADGMKAKYKDNVSGWTNEVVYTAEGLKTAIPSMGQVVDNGDGTITIQVCGCCGSVYELYGIPTHSQAAETANAAGYPNLIKTVNGATWVGSSPNTYTHNLDYYIYGK